MKYSVITPTYNRPEKLIRCVESVLNQNRSNNIKDNFDFELIIVNDSPLFDYGIFNNYLYKLKVENFENFSKIKYFVNKENMGVNYSRNYALDYVSKDTTSDYVIFLDDDDWLSGDALLELENKIKETNKLSWYISKRTFEDMKDLSDIPEYNKYYDFTWDHLILKKIRQERTNIISSKLIRDKNILYSKYIKQAEELIFFHHLSKYIDMYALDLPTTLTEGFLIDGLSKNKDKKTQRIKQTLTLLKEARERNVLDFKFSIYLLLRIFAIIIKK